MATPGTDRIIGTQCTLTITCDTQTSALVIADLLLETDTLDVTYKPTTSVTWPVGAAQEHHQTVGRTWDMTATGGMTGGGTALLSKFVTDTLNANQPEPKFTVTATGTNPTTKNSFSYTFKDGTLTAAGVKFNKGNAPVEESIGFSFTQMA